ncbi:hypothetical protein PGT21_003577 [Puccinia graminis f. sp. tritici]|uniref:Uncharacterized protein n=1 Tax=Puccinia graminis f. sp. tritici TaxID=56615 RepID=A0A5B0N595_PUCGR|nr:hypothetical protein PGT21_003577 [Puccinia graminis f. sp. tritici]
MLDDDQRHHCLHANDEQGSFGPEAHQQLQPDQHIQNDTSNRGYEHGPQGLERLAELRKGWMSMLSVVFNLIQSMVTNPTTL